MGGWGINPNASKKEKIKAGYHDYIHALNSIAEIDYDIYSELFDVGMQYLDDMYEQGKADAYAWISVKDKLPEWGEEVIFTDDEDVATGYLLGDMWYDWGGNNHEPTAWMPLPEPPEEK